MGFRNLDTTDICPFSFGYYVAGFHLFLHTGKHGNQLQIWMKSDPLRFLRSFTCFPCLADSSKVLVRGQLYQAKWLKNEEVSHSVPGTFFFFFFKSDPNGSECEVNLNLRNLKQNRDETRSRKQNSIKLLDGDTFVSCEQT